jgi:hypothetical protein
MCSIKRTRWHPGGSAACGGGVNGTRAMERAAVQETQ